jgi:hypothetical protein
MVGILIADRLTRRGLPVHLSLHDDPAGGQFARSARFQYLKPLADRAVRRVLHTVASADTVCGGMKKYYEQRFGVVTSVVHRYIPALPAISRFHNSEAGVLTAGHIGSIYSVNEFRQFCRAFRHYARLRGLKPQFVVIAGRNARTQSVYEEFDGLIFDHPQMPENVAVQNLTRCDFLYAMYPFSPLLTVFRRTSSPTKLTTYLQAQRPILGHTPADSSLAAILTTYRLGLVCSSILEAGITQTIDKLRSAEINSAAFERARSELHGYHNVGTLQRLLVGSEPLSAEPRHEPGSISGAAF